jgi:hypothetical protein
MVSEILRPFARFTKGNMWQAFGRGEMITGDDIEKCYMEQELEKPPKWP